MASGSGSEGGGLVAGEVKRKSSRSRAGCQGWGGRARVGKEGKGGTRAGGASSTPLLLVRSKGLGLSPRGLFGVSRSLETGEAISSARRSAKFASSLPSWFGSGLRGQGIGLK